MYGMQYMAAEEEKEKLTKNMLPGKLKLEDLKTDTDPCSLLDLNKKKKSNYRCTMQ